MIRIPACLLPTLGLAAIAALGIAGAGSAAGAGEATHRSCELPREVRQHALRVIDGETFSLSDGRVVRLAGALAPAPPQNTTAETWLPSRNARDALAALIENRSVQLAFSGARADRHGRRLAHVFVEQEGGALWVQGEMIGLGHAQAHALPGHALCLEALLAREEDARVAGRGLWAHAAHGVHAAERTGELMRRRSEFTVVEGAVAGAAERSGRLYLNFGSDWRRDFTVVVPPKVLRESGEAGQRLKSLTLGRVRVRGWIERRNGPSIEVSDVREIEVLDPRAAASDPQH